MKKISNIAWKDLIVTFRDPGALILMLVTPFALTLSMAFAFGGLTGDGASFSDIPVAIVNHDDGQFGEMLVQVFESEDLAELVEPSVMSEDDAVRERVDANDAAAAVIIPAGLSDSIILSDALQGASSGGVKRATSVIEVYTNPTRSISAGVIQGIVDEFVNRLTAGVAGVQVTMTQLVVNGVISAQQAPVLGQEIGERAVRQTTEPRLITIESELVGAEEEEAFNVIAYMAPSMAIFFLMFTVTAGGRSILDEREGGTLPRMLVSPTSAAQVLGGKIFGTYLTGSVQMAILIVASTLLFDMGWGSPLPIAVLVLALVAAATAWGMAIAAYSRTPGQAGTLGSAVSLTFGIGAGHFLPRDVMPEWLQTVSYVSPNAWGLEAFTELSSGGALADITTPIAALLAMAVVVFAAAIVLFRRSYT